MMNMKTLLILVWVLVCSVESHATTYTDQATFNAALAGHNVSSDDFAPYPQGNIANGQTLGAFTYSYDSNTTQAGIASNGIGGQALGDTSFGTDPNSGGGIFSGGEAVTLMYNGANPLVAFGAVFSYAPNFEPVPGSLYQLNILDGPGAGTAVGNLDGLDPSGGSFFLGFIGAPFTSVSLQSAATDAFGNPYLTPGYQVDSLDYGSAAPVPEPNTLALLVMGIAALVIVTRYRSVITEC